VLSDANLGDATGALTFNGGSLNIDGTFNSTRDLVLQQTAVINTGLDGVVSSSGDVAGNGGLVKQGGGAMTLAGTLAQAGGVTLDAGMLTLTGTNTYTGGTTLNAGVLRIQSDANLGNAAGALTFNGGTLSINGTIASERDIQLNGNGNIVTQFGDALSSSGDVSGAGALSKDGRGVVEFTGTLSHAGGLFLNNGGMILSGSNTYTGGTKLNAGTLRVSSDANLGDAAGALTFNGGSLSSTGNLNSTRDLLLQQNAVISTAAGTTLSNSGNVSGNGGLVKNGEGAMALSGTLAHAGGTTVNDGVMTLTGSNSYTGGTTLNGGVLQVLSDASLGDASGALTFNGGTLNTFGDMSSARDLMLQQNAVISTAANTTLSNSGNVSGNGGLVKNGAGGMALTGSLAHAGGTTVNDGVMTLTGSNSYTGGTTLNGGVLQVQRDANLGHAADALIFNGGTLVASASFATQRTLQINDRATLQNAAGTTLTLAGTTAGEGMLVKQGSGTLVLAGANHHTGGTVVDGSTVVLANAGGLGSGTVALNNALLQSQVSARLAQALLLAGSSTAQVGAGTTLTLSGPIDGSRTEGCFTKTGTGQLTLAGNAVMAAGLCVNQGMLSTNGLLAGNVQVDDGAALRGTGIISGNLHVDGTLAPGNSPGTLVVNGSVTMTADSTLQIDIDGYGTGNGAGNHSRVVLNGAGSQFIAAGTLNPVLRGISGDASNTFTPKLGDIFRIVSGQGGVVGTFDTLLQPTTGMAAGTRFQLYYTTGKDIDLYVTPSLYAEQLRGQVNGNVLATAAALDGLVRRNDAGTASAQQADLLRAVWQQTTLSLPEMVTALTGQTHAQLGALAHANATALGEEVSGRLSRGTLLDTATAPIEQMLWANLGHGDLSVDAGADADALDARQRRATAGIDVYRSARVAWGAGLGRSTANLDGSRDDNSVDSNAMFAYAVTRAGSFVLDGMVGYSVDRWQSQRIDALTPSAQLRSKVSGSTRMADAGVSLPFTAAGLTWQPSLRGSWHKVERNAFSEGGDSLAALDVARYQGEGGRALLGLSVGSLQANPLQSRMTWQLGLQGGVNFGQARQAEMLTSLGGENVVVHSAETGKSFGRAQLQGTLRLGASSYLYGGISSEQGSGVENNSINAGIRIAL